MKRYRVLAYDFDTRANLLSEEINDKWNDTRKKQWQDIQNKIKADIIAQFGKQNADQKIKNFIEIEYLPFSFIAFHNKFIRQIRTAYVIGAYYPALTSACALGERILNHLIIHLRDDFRETNEYRRVYRKSSFTNWNVAIDTLESWKILLPEVVQNFRELKKKRDKAIHFNPETDINDKKLALDAIKKLTEIVSGQFSSYGKQPWFIPGTSNGYIKNGYENVSFVKRIIIPNCKLVGPYHTLTFKGNKLIINDDYNYEDRKISDSEFLELLKNRKL